MVKHFKIIMAAVISGIVALCTTYLGVSGTVIGSVFSSFLYQLLSGYFEEKTENIDFLDSNIFNRSNSQNNRFNSNTKNINNKKSNWIKLNNNLSSKIAFIFPIIVIILIEILFCLTDIDYNFVKLFRILELATSQNLFRVMGIALVILGVYPFFKSSHIKEINGILLFISGILLLFRGFIDFHPLLLKIYHNFLYQVDSLFAFIIIILLVGVVLNVLIEGFKQNSINSNSNRGFNSRKIDTNMFNNHKGNNRINGSLNNQNNVRNSVDWEGVDNYDSYNDCSVSYNHSGENVGHQEYDNNLPIYEEDYIYVSNPKNPNKPIKKKILKKIKNPSNKFKRK